MTAIGEGDCTFRIAYANPADSNFSFEEYAKTNGLIISIPIQVGGDKRDKNEKFGCNEETENCALYNEYGITPKVIKKFNIMGYQAWMRAFTTTEGLFVWLPQAIMWTRASRGSVRAAE